MTWPILPLTLLWHVSIYLDWAHSVTRSQVRQVIETLVAQSFYNVLPALPPLCFFHPLSLVLSLLCMLLISCYHRVTVDSFLVSSGNSAVPPHLCACVVADLMYPIRMIILRSDVLCWSEQAMAATGPKLYGSVFSVYEIHNRWSCQLLFYTSYTEQKYKHHTFVFACIFHEVKTSSVHTKQLYIITFWAI